MSSNACIWPALVDLIVLWLVNKLARAITKWTRACDKRPARLISYFQFTCEYQQHFHVGNTAQQCRLRLFLGADFAGDLEDSKSISGESLCICGSHTLVPKSWMCKNQTCVSHSTTESEIISLEAGLRMYGIPALDLWDLIIAVMHSNRGMVKNPRRKRYLRETLQTLKDILHCLMLILFPRT